MSGFFGGPRLHVADRVRAMTWMIVLVTAVLLGVAAVSGGASDFTNVLLAIAAVTFVLRLREEARELRHLVIVASAGSPDGKVRGEARRMLVDAARTISGRSAARRLDALLEAGADPRREPHRTELDRALGLANFAGVDADALWIERNGREVEA